MDARSAIAIAKTVLRKKISRSKARLRSGLAWRRDEGTSLLMCFGMFIKTSFLSRKSDVTPERPTMPER